MLCTLAGGIFSLFFWTFGAISLVGCIMFALFNGIVAGVMWATLAPVCAEVVGLAMIPSGMPSPHQFSCIVVLLTNCSNVGNLAGARVAIYFCRSYWSQSQKIWSTHLSPCPNFYWRHVYDLLCVWYVGHLICRYSVALLALLWWAKSYEIGWALRAWKVKELEEAHRKLLCSRKPNFLIPYLRVSTSSSMSQLFYSLTTQIS